MYFGGGAIRSGTIAVVGRWISGAGRKAAEIGVVVRSGIPLLQRDGGRTGLLMNLVDRFLESLLAQSRTEISGKKADRWHGGGRKMLLSQSRMRDTLTYGGKLLLEKPGRRKKGGVRGQRSIERDSFLVCSCDTTSFISLHLTSFEES